MRRHLEAGVSQAPVKLTALLAETKLTTSEVRHLEVGDVLLTEHPREGGVKVLVEGRPLFEGFAGLYRGHKAIRISRRLERRFQKPDNGSPFSSAKQTAATDPASSGETSPSPTTADATA